MENMDNIHTHHQFPIKILVNILWRNDTRCVSGENNIKR